MILGKNMKSDYNSGIVILLITQIIWGILPVYWQMLIPIDSFVIILYRIVTMLITCYLYVKIFVRPKKLFDDLVESRKSFFTYLSAGILITINWGFFIWAINAGRVVDASMGYYIEPLMICAIGRFVFNEKINRWKKIALLLGVVAIVVMIVGYKQVPLVSLVLAVTFSIYATIKKTVKIHPVKSMLYETLFVAPIALVLLIRAEFTEFGAFQVEEKYKFV